jgi:hypothetical protein
MQDQNMKQTGNRTKRNENWQKLYPFPEHEKHKVFFISSF